MKILRYHLVDVFAESKFSGNPLAVFNVINMDVSQNDMLSLAKEINYPEIVFITSQSFEGEFNIRIFTPTEEVPFAGHPSLGTAFVLQKEILRKPIDKIILNMKAGKIPVTINYNSSKKVDMLWMKQLSPVFFQTFSPKLISAILCIDEDEIDLRYPIQELSTGLPTVIVPLRSLKGVESCRINLEKYCSFVRGIDAKLIHVFCPESHDPNSTLHVRNFGDFYGISEEPATGSANGCLAAYLLKHDYLKTDSVNIKVEQGREIGRLGHLYLRSAVTNNLQEVSVGGKVHYMGKGEFYL